MDTGEQDQALEKEHTSPRLPSSAQKADEDIVSSSQDDRGGQNGDVAPLPGSGAEKEGQVMDASTLNPKL